MEAVQSSQEEMAAELKELLKQGVFSQAEAKQIIIKRTAYESALVRLQPRKADYLRYIEYLMALEALRKKRVNRLNLPTTGHSVADYCFVRAQFHIFERALRPFKDDVGLWVQFIESAKREKATTLAGRIAVRALQMHPTSVPLYILSAAHQMKLQSPGVARTMLQRGLRMNPESTQLWTEYLKMELEYIEARREEMKQLEEMRQQQMKLGDDDDMDEEMIIPEIKDEEGMQAIMDGAIVKEVIKNAVKALPRVSLFAALHRAITDYPTPLRAELLNLLHALLLETLPNDAQAIRLSVSWSLTLGSEEDEMFVDRLQAAIQKFEASVKSDVVLKDEIGAVYSGWVVEWEGRLKNEFLKAYLVRSFHALITTLPSTRLSPILLSTDLKLQAANNDTPSPKLLKRARKYVDRFPESPELWLGYLLLLKRDEDSSVEHKQAEWREARSKARGAVELLCPIWLWGISLSSKGKVKQSAYKDILRSSIQHSVPDLHPYLLLEYIQRIYTLSISPTERLATVTDTMTSYLPSDACYRFAFNKEVHCGGTSKDVLLLLHGRWRQIPGSEVEAGLCYAEWLVREGEGKEAKDVIDRTRVVVDEDAREVLDGHWSRILNGMMEVDDEKEDEESEEEDTSEVIQGLKLPTPPPTPKADKSPEKPKLSDKNANPMDLDFISLNF